MINVLETRDDLQWLEDVHHVPVAGVAVAILYGNEDCPDKIETFANNHYQCVPRTYRMDDNDGYQEVTDA